MMTKLLLLLLAALSAFGQTTQERLIRSFIELTGLKNTVQASPEARAEVARLEQDGFRASIGAEQALALRNLRHAIAVLRGQPWTPLRALGEGLTVTARPALVEPGRKFELAVGQAYPLEKQPEGKLRATVVFLELRGNAPAARPAAVVKTLEAPAGDWAASPWKIEAVAPDLPDGRYMAAVSLELDGEAPARQGAMVSLERGVGAIEAAVAQAEARAAKLKGPAAATVQYRLSLAARARAGEALPPGVSFRKEFEQAAADLAELEAGRDPLAKQRGDVRRAYRSAVDQTLQPYRLFVPGAYDAAKAWPLVVALHGAGGNENSYFEGYEKGSIKRLAEERGYLVVCPRGRGPYARYLGDAEKDVFDVIAEVRRAYRVDAARIYLTGHSMGGGGTLSVAAAQPEMFAALAPFAPALRNLPDIKGKIAKIPMMVVQGDKDALVPVGMVREFVKAMQEAGAKVRYIEVPGGDHGSVVAPGFEGMFDWFGGWRKE